MSEQTSPDLLGLTANIVSAHVAHNPVGAEALPSLIESVYRSLSTAGAPQPKPTAAAQIPAVPPKKSVFPDYIVCLEDGKKKTLKRHLQVSFGLSPDAYRAKWGVPANYPMVAPNYAATRSDLAKKLGLGRKPAGRPPDIGPSAPRRRGARLVGRAT